MADFTRGRPGSVEEGEDGDRGELGGGEEEGSRGTSSLTKTHSLSVHANAIRQMIAAELEATRIRSSQARRGRSSDAAPQPPASSSRASELIKAYAAVGGPSSVLNNRALTAKRPAGKRDFFGRIIPVNPVNPTHPADPTDRPSALERTSPSRRADAVRLWYRHHEGFTNAVRRPLRIKDLFPSRRAP